MVDIQDYIDLYRSMPDYKLRILAQSEFNELRPEAQSAIMIVIKERGLDKRVEEFRIIQNTPITENDIDNLISNRQLISCPQCGCHDGTLNVLELFQFGFGYVVFFWKNKIIVGCKECIINELKSIRNFYCIGLFLVPIQTIISIGYIFAINNLIKRIEIDNSPTEFLRSYIIRNYHEIKGTIQAQK